MQYIILKCDEVSQYLVSDIECCYQVIERKLEIMAHFQYKDQFSSYRDLYYRDDVAVIPILFFYWEFLYL